jgi:hypothetical protein
MGHKKRPLPAVNRQQRPCCQISHRRPIDRESVAHPANLHETERRTTPMIVTVTSQKGGVGKTTTAVSLASHFASESRRTMLIDLDPQGHCAISLGHDPAPGVHRWIEEREHWGAVCVEARPGGLTLVPGNSQSKLVTHHRIEPSLTSATSFSTRPPMGIFRRLPSVPHTMSSSLPAAACSTWMESTPPLP